MCNRQPLPHKHQTWRQRKTSELKCECAENICNLIFIIFSLICKGHLVLHVFSAIITAQNSDMKLKNGRKHLSAESVPLSILQWTNYRRSTVFYSPIIEHIHIIIIIMISVKLFWLYFLNMNKLLHVHWKVLF